MLRYKKDFIRLDNINNNSTINDDTRKWERKAAVVSRKSRITLWRRRRHSEDEQVNIDDVVVKVISMQHSGGDSQHDPSPGELAEEHSEDG